MRQARRMSRSIKRPSRTGKRCTCPSTPPTTQVGRMMAPQSLPPTPHWSSCSRNGWRPGGTTPLLHTISPLCSGVPCAGSGWTETVMGSVMGLCQVAHSLALACPHPALPLLRALPCSLSPEPVPTYAGTGCSLMWRHGNPIFRHFQIRW